MITLAHGVVPPDRATVMAPGEPAGLAFGGVLADAWRGHAQRNLEPIGGELVGQHRREF